MKSIAAKENQIQEAKAALAVAETSKSVALTAHEAAKYRLLSLKNEDDLVGDMKLLYSEIIKEYDESSIFLLGYSMGSGIAAQVAAENDPKGLMIWTPYYSMVDMKNASYPFLPSFLVRYPLRTDLALQKIEEPITIFYAAKDQVLPVDRAIKLNKFLDGNDQHFMLKGQGHNGVFFNEEVRKRVPEILNRM